MKRRIAIIGGGISGLSLAHLLREQFFVTVFEKESVPGGLLRCQRVHGGLFHTCGGHVFNSKYEDVLQWFWGFFDKDAEFVKAERNSVVWMGNQQIIPYPIENHAYMLPDEIVRKIAHDLVLMSKAGNNIAGIDNFEEFLVQRFGQTLYDIYFKPYNEKIWRRRLNDVPITWLEGKLPMPTVEEIIYNNFKQVEEKSFVHSSFWYEKNNGSQFIIDRLSHGLSIKCNADVCEIERMPDGTWQVCAGAGCESFDYVVFCGNIKQLPTLLKNLELCGFSQEIEVLEYHGTTTVFCEISPNPYSWVYLPSNQYEAHRIICTGNFSPTNNGESHTMTGTIEFTDAISEDVIRQNLRQMPLSPRYITHLFNPYTYPIQNGRTRQMITELKKFLSTYGFYTTGRFADWEYYNMDVAIKAAMETSNAIKSLKYH